MLETKRAIKPLLTRQPRNRGERHEDASNGNPEQLQYVALFIVANFMRKYGFQFRLGELRDECVEQDNFSKTSESGKEGVGVTRAFAAIHLDAARGKIRALRQRKEAFAQRSFRQRCELVEKRHNHRRRNEQQEQLKRDDNRRRPKPPVCASQHHKFKHRRGTRKRNNLNPMKTVAPQSPPVAPVHTISFNTSASSG